MGCIFYALIHNINNEYMDQILGFIKNKRKCTANDFILLMFDRQTLDCYLEVLESAVWGPIILDNELC